jgi:hypothetical protein
MCSLRSWEMSSCLRRRETIIGKQVSVQSPNVWFVFIMSSVNEQEHIQMQGGDDDVNWAYQSAVEWQFKEVGGREALHDEFESWFAAWDSGAVPTMGDVEMCAA